MAISLDEGSLARMLDGVEEKPTVQILGIRKMNQKGPQERYRMIISDGVNSINFAMLGTQLNPRVESGDFSEFTIVKLVHSITSKIKDKNGISERKVIIVLECEVLVPGSDVNTRIGNPVPLSEDQTQQAVTAGNKENGNANSGIKQEQEKPLAPKPAAAAPPSMPSNMGQQPPKRPRMDPGISEANIRPISSINPFQNKWVIKARVTAKPAIRTWSNQRGEGKLFSMDLQDQTGEIRATAFNEEVDKFFGMIEVGKVYMIGNCVVKSANKKFSALKNDYEISFNRETFVQEVDHDSDIPEITYDAKPIATIKDTAVDELIDIVAVCHSCNDVQTIITRATNKELKKREVTLVDQSEHSVTLTMWGNDAEEFNLTGNPIMAIRKAKVGEYQNNKNISMLMSSNFVFNPDIPEAHRLRGWYDNGGSTNTFTGISAAGGPASGSYGYEPWKSLIDIKNEGLGLKDKPDYLGCVVSIVSFKRDNFYYLACPIEDCKKKVIDLGNGDFKCEKCDKEYQDSNPRMILSVNVADWSNNIWVTLFDDEAQTLLGVNGREMKRLKEEQSDDFNAIFDKLRFTQLQLKLRVKNENYNDEQRLKTSVAKLELLKLPEHNKRLLKEINEMRAQLGE